MDAWYAWPIVISWLAVGLLTWIIDVIRHRSITIGDLIFLPVFVLLGWVSMLIWLLTVVANDKTTVLWRC